MKSNLLTCSNFGKFYPSNKHNYYSIELGSAKVVQIARFSLQGDKVYLLDKTGTLLCLALNDKSISTLSSQKLHLFQIDSHNPFELYAVTRESNLLKIAFFNKTVNKIMNLNVNRIIDFEKNHFTNVLLLVQFQIVMLIDANCQTGVKIRSIKAANGENYIAGKFLGQNRFLAIILKNNQLRIIEAHKFNTVNKLKLPFSIKNLKLSTSYDGSMLVIYGQNSNILLVYVSKQGKTTYQILKLSINSVVQVKFTYENDIVLLANDGLLYGISSKKVNKLTLLFNEEKSIKINHFDISFNSKAIALAANKLVHILQFSLGLKVAIESQENYQEIQVQPQGDYENNQSGKKFQYPQDKDTQQKHKKLPSQFQLNKALLTPHDFPSFSKPNETLDIIQQVSQLKVPQTKKRQINEIYHYLHDFDFIRRIVHLQKEKIINFIQKLLMIFIDPKKVTLAAYHILNSLSASLQDGSLQKYALILSPRVIQRINRVLHCEFKDFIILNILNLFEDYLNFSDSVQLIMILINNCHRESFIPIFMVTLLLQFRKNSQSWPSIHKYQIYFKEVLAETQNLLTNPKNAYIFAKEIQLKQEQELEEDENLQQLLAKQSKIDYEINQLKKIKN